MRIVSLPTLLLRHRRVKAMIAVPSCCMGNHTPYVPRNSKLIIPRRPSIRTTRTTRRRTHRIRSRTHIKRQLRWQRVPRNPLRVIMLQIMHIRPQIGAQSTALRSCLATQLLVLTQARLLIDRLL
jgi:hypothetical protein